MIRKELQASLENPSFHSSSAGRDSGWWQRNGGRKIYLEQKKAPISAAGGGPGKKR